MRCGRRAAHTADEPVRRALVLGFQRKPVGSWNGASCRLLLAALSERARLHVAKSSLQLQFQNQSHSLPNSAAGHRRLRALLHASDTPVHVVCEASGGYEQNDVRALQEAQTPVRVVDPARVRHFVCASGQRAKTDRIDAALLAHYGEQMQPRPRRRREEARFPLL